jgi:hypothetical protein
MSTEAPFFYDVAQTAIAIGYQNEDFIADKVLPPASTGSSQKYSWRRYRLAEIYSIPDTEVGRTGRPNEVEFSFDEFESRTKDWGLEDPIPQSDIDNAAAGNAPNPVNNVTEMLTELTMLDRERRVANLVQTASIYPASQRITLSGTSQFSDPNSDPLGVIASGLDTMIRRANVMVINREAFTKLSMHPKMVKAFYGNEGGSGIVTADFMAKLFGLEEVVIGSAWYNQNRRNQTPLLTRLWGKHISLIRRQKISFPYTMTFGVTAMTGNRIAGQRPDPDIGLKGGTRVRVGVHCEENICGPEFGYFIQNAVA